MKMPSLIDLLLDLAYPRLCVMCGRKLQPAERHVCAFCLSRLPCTDFHLRPDNPMAQHFFGQTGMERAAALLFYHRGDASGKIDFLPTLKRLVRVPRYREGVVAQFFYVGAQIMCWTFIIQYGTRLFMDMGMAEQAAEVRSQQFNIAAMALFCVSRFICTFLLRFFNSGLLLRTLAVFAALFTLGVMFFQNIWGMYCVVGVSACMSLMFPTIYGIALQGLGDDAKFGAAGLIMAILGGSVLPPLQAAIIDQHELWGMPAVNLSFVLPFICFLVVVVYGHRSYRKGWS